MRTRARWHGEQGVIGLAVGTATYGALQLLSGETPKVAGRCRSGARPAGHRQR